ncbi:MAG: class F sortase [Coriobacteriales bacterium]|nr:class F sortase [Coriobacteriales bacterium]
MTSKNYRVAIIAVLIVIVALVVLAVFLITSPSVPGAANDQAPTQATSFDDFSTDTARDKQAAPSENYTPTVVEGHTPSAIKSQPYLISIPVIGIENIGIESVGVGRQGPGILDDPVDFWKFGWYKASPSPGIAGQGVYTAHTGSGVSAIGDGLIDLVIDDVIIIENSGGRKFHYRVIETKIVPREEVDMAEFQAVYPGYEQGLSIMTCTGPWDEQYGSSADRLLIKAVLM